MALELREDWLYQMRRILSEVKDALEKECQREVELPIWLSRDKDWLDVSTWAKLSPTKVGQVECSLDEEEIRAICEAWTDNTAGITVNIELPDAMNSLLELHETGATEGAGSGVFQEEDAAMLIAWAESFEDQARQLREAATRTWKDG